MALYRISLLREVIFTECVTVDIDLPCPPHPSDEEVRAAILKAKAVEELDWMEKIDSRIEKPFKIDIIDGIADDDDTIVETGFD